MIAGILNRKLSTILTGFAAASVLILGIATAVQGAGNPSADLDQWGNDAPASWQNGNLNDNQATYFEGDSVPYRMKFDNLATGGGNPHTVTIEWDTTKSGKHALDYLTSYDRTTSPNPCAGVSGCAGPADTETIPTDPNALNQQAGVFSLFGGTITGVSGYTVTGSYAGDSSTKITITFTATNANPVLAWGGHIATRADWGATNSAISISGSPYHTRLLDLDGKGGNQDRSLSADAVIFPASITIIKDATPNGSTSFTFTGSPSPLTGFSLVDDGTNANTKVFSNILNFKKYTVGETVPAGWTLTGIVCNATTPNGGSASVTVPSVEIDLKEGENWTCTFGNQQQLAHLTLVKSVTNDNGGTATATDWTLTADGPTDLSGTSGSGAVTSAEVTPGIYTLAEQNGPAGYTGGTYSCVKNGGQAVSSNSITLAPADSATCTINNNDDAPQLHLRKTITNNNGGSATITDWTLNATGALGSPTNLSGTTPVDSTTGFKADTYALSETNGPANYTAGDWDCGTATKPDATHVTVPLGANVTCTINNNDNAPQLHLRKTITNDNGGSATVTDWTLNAAGADQSPTNLSGSTPVDSTGTFKADTYALSETNGPSGYTPSAWDCGAATMPDATHVTVPFGGNVTCTINNDDNQAYITVTKVVVNNNGGLAQPNDFSLTLEGTGVSSGVPVPVNPGTYTAGETQVSGYAFTGYSGDCDSNGDTTVALGESKTCTLTNNDIAPTLTLVKTVVNDNGGNAVADDFQGKIDGNDVDWATANTLNAGNYTASETNLPGYTAGSWGGDCAADGSVTLGIGDNKTCTITNDDQQAYITVTKVVTNDNGGSAAPDDFSLTLEGNATTSGTAVAVNPGTYTAGETLLDGYSFEGFSGDCDVNGDTTVALGDNKTCTLTNNDNAPILHLRKLVTNDNGGTAIDTDWTLSANGTDNNDLLGSTPVDSDGTLKADTFTLSESGPTGYSASAWDCVGGQQATDTITLGLGEEATCTITNDDISPQLTVIKHVVNDNGGNNVAGDFTMNVTATNPSDDSFAGSEVGTTIDLDAGSYSADESAFAGYSKSLGTDCSGSIAVGETKTCTITNDDISPTLTLIKSVTNNNGGTAGVNDFGLTVGGSATNSGVVHNVNANTAIALNEAGLTGYSFVSITGDAKCPSVLGGSVTLDEGENVTCTINNDDQAAHLIVIKHVVNDNGGISVAGNFTLNITGVTASGGNSVTGAEAPGVNKTLLSVGNYDVHEGLVTGYTTSYSTDCTGTIALGQTKTCTVTNDDVPPPVTRTQGFWQTHLAFTTTTFDNSNNNGYWVICAGGGRTIDTVSELMGGFYASIPKLSSGGKRADIDQARMQLLQQLLAAMLNKAAFGTDDGGLIAAGRLAFCGGTKAQILTLAGQLDAFNNSGDSSAIVGNPGKADPKGSKGTADIPTWDHPISG